MAIKVPQPDRISTANDVEAYLREARNVAMLDHPNIVPVFDYGEDPKGRCFVVSKLIDGGNLKKLIAAERRPGLAAADCCDRRGNLKNLVAAMRATIEEFVRPIAIVAEALHHAHQKGLVHRDIKPANILIAKDGQVFVADFGMAIRDDEQRGRAGEIAGTPWYMAPEQVRGEVKLLDGRADIWALGVILYEMLAQRRPFDGETPKQVFDEIEHRDPKPLRMIDDTIPKEVERVCLKCLSKDVRDRYTSAGDVAAELRQATGPAAGSFDSQCATVRIQIDIQVAHWKQPIETIRQICELLKAGESAQVVDVEQLKAGESAQVVQGFRIPRSRYRTKCPGFGLTLALDAQVAATLVRSINDGELRGLGIVKAQPDGSSGILAHVGVNEKGVVASLLDVLRDGDTSIRIRAACALKSLLDADCGLVWVLMDKDPHLRLRVVETLQEMTAGGRSREMLDLIRQGLDRRQIVKALSESAYVESHPLPEEYRPFVELYYLQENTPQEIADKLGLALKSVQKKLVCIDRWAAEHRYQPMFRLSHHETSLKQILLQELDAAVAGA